jgi:hypothetical protein
MAGAVPASMSAPCPRCSNALRQFINTSQGGVQYRCAGCEWLFTASTQAPTGTGTAAVTTASTAITVASGGASFTAGMLLLYDTAANAEVVRAAGGSTGTSIPVIGFTKAHSGGVTFGQLLLTPAFQGIERVPIAPGWGF